MTEYLDKALAFQRIRDHTARNIDNALVGRSTFTVDDIVPTDAVETYRKVISLSGETESEARHAILGLVNDVLRYPKYRKKLRVAINPTTNKLQRKSKQPIYYTPRVPSTDYAGIVPGDFVLIPASTSRSMWPAAATKALDLLAAANATDTAYKGPHATDDLTLHGIANSDHADEDLVPHPPTATIDLRLSLELTLPQLARLIDALKP